MEECQESCCFVGQDLLLGFVDRAEDGNALVQIFNRGHGSATGLL